MKNRSWHLFPLIAWSFLPLACTKAIFSGSGQNSRVQTSESPPSAEKITCSLSPAEVKTGEKSTLSVSSTGSYSELSQTVVRDDSRVEKILTQANGVVAPKDGGANEIVAEVAGTYKVEIRPAGGGEVLASCELKAAPVDGSNSSPNTSPPTLPLDQNPVTPGSPGNPPLPECRPDQVKIGTQIAFVIDNSNSNAATDCPGSIKTGSFGSADTYACSQETSREKAVLAVFDVLKAFSADSSANALAVSQIAVTSFPTMSDFVSGYKVETPFLAVNAAGRSQLEAALKFTRKPYGLTPYLAAMNSAEDVMKGSAADKRSKVVVMVTDGEPTDRGPKSAAAKADSLRAAGLKVITVYYSSNSSRSERNALHKAMMQRIEDAYNMRPERHWYDTTQHSDFSSYIGYLLGTAQAPSLLERITSKVEPSCQDAPGSTCARKSYDVGDAENLKKAFLDIVTTQAIGCGS